MNKTKSPNIFFILTAFLLVVTMSVLTSGQTISPSIFWKNEITFPYDPFRVEGSSASEPGWVKFTILLEPYDPNIVYFQDGHEYTFHYHFASELLDPFIGMTPEQFNQATLFRDSRKAVLGAVILPPRGGYPQLPEYSRYGIQFVGHDIYSKEEIVELFDIVKSSIAAGPEVQAFYFPTYEQKAAARADQDWLEAHGVPLSSPDRWAKGNTCYSQGWALGKLMYVEGSDIDNAYYSGLLKPEDILITDGVPAEVPYLAGIISLSPSTPNSHVAILAQNSAIPFVYLTIADDVNRAMELVEHKIVLQAYETDGSYDIRLIDVEGVLNDETINEILTLKEPLPLEIIPISLYGSYSACTDDLLPSDIKFFGGKAANFGILRKAIPENSPVSLALSFDLWNEFIAQGLYNGRTLREEIDTRLEPYIQPPIDPLALSVVLDDIRGLFTDTSVTDFTDTQRQAIISILQGPRYGFDPNNKIRFRSSTNMEDSEQFTGAGLYDSYSGCLADDLDTDEQGSCRCDPDESRERGVFRAIRKVFASFYNDNAFLERLRYDVNEHEVGMAILVHHSFPDEIELANGVATVERKYSTSWDITLVTQNGATSVTNPADGSIPEEVEVSVYSFGIFPKMIRQSNLVPLGGKVMYWQDDYVNLSELLVRIAEQFSTVTDKDKFLLEMEYKKIAPDGKLVVKQVRQIPQPDQTPSIIPFLLNEPVEYCTFQGEFGDVFANHRLKSQWTFQTENLWLSEENLARNIYSGISFEYVADTSVRILKGVPSQWPFAIHSYNGDTISDTWVMHHLSNQRICTLLVTDIPNLVPLAQSPILTLTDIGQMTLEVEYENPVHSGNWSDNGTTRTESVSLCQCLKPQDGVLLQERQFKDFNGIFIKTTFYWPTPPKGNLIGYTAPLVRWLETVIEGYTNEPIVLHGYYSQTYKPEHHNFDEHFIFEPQLEPDISDDVLAELRLNDVRMIHVFGGISGMEITTYGYDEKPFLPADLDNDDDVDGQDFAIFAKQWRETNCDSCEGADLTGDGQVYPDDLQEFVDNWLVDIAP